MVLEPEEVIGIMLDTVPEPVEDFMPELEADVELGPVEELCLLGLEEELALVMPDVVVIELDGDMFEEDMLEEDMPEEDMLEEGLFEDDMLEDDMLEDILEDMVDALELELMIDAVLLEVDEDITLFVEVDAGTPPAVNVAPGP